MSVPVSSTAPAAWPDLSGRIIDGRHVLPVRVYFEDTDFTGVAYHGSYVRWCERGRSDYLRCLGVSHTELAEGDVPASFAVRTMTFDFFRPAKIDDILTITTRTLEMGGATVALEQAVKRGDELLVCAKVKVALISEQGRPLRIRGSFRALFEA